MKLRSEKERRFASWLRRNNLSYEYEKVQFVSDRGRVYTPDFFIPDRKVIVEIKPLPLISVEFNGWRRALVEHQLKRYESIFFILDMPGDNPEVYKAFDGFSEWIDDLSAAKAVFEKIFKLSKPLPPLKDQPNAVIKRTFPKPTTEEWRKNFKL